MNRTEGDACVRILLAVVHADGHVASDEARALEILAGEVGVSLPPEDELVDILREAARIRSVEARQATYEAAVAMAALDGHVAEVEHALLVRLQTALELSDTFDVEASEAVWDEHLDIHRARIAAADVDFLHRVADASLDAAAYIALTDGLRAEHGRILAEALELAGLRQV